jgi:hypothetical protein
MTSPISWPVQCGRIVCEVWSPDLSTLRCVIICSKAYGHLGYCDPKIVNGEIKLSKPAPDVQAGDLVIGAWKCSSRV